MKSFDDIINGKVNEQERLTDKWRGGKGWDTDEQGVQKNIRMLYDIMVKLEEIEAKIDGLPR